MTEEATLPSSERQPRRLITIAIGASLLTIGLAILGTNYVLVGRPISTALARDSRNDGYDLRGHYRYYVDPTTVVLDLRAVRSAAPIDLFRGVFQSAEALKELRPPARRIILSRSGTPVFQMSGEDFRDVGISYAAGENPIYLIRTWPEKLYRLDGRPAYERWEGGFLGVLSRQMEDANDAGQRWASGSSVYAP